MRTNSKFQIYLSALIISLFFTANFAKADTENIVPKFSFNVSSVSEFVKSTTDAVTNVFKNNDQIENSNLKLKDQEKSIEIKEELNICELHDVVFLNTLVLNNNSAEAQQKIGKIEDTIDEEMLLRENIFSTTNDRNLNSLQKKEKLIFKDMKKELEDAKKYYINIDDKSAEIVISLEENECDNEIIDESKEKVLQGNFTETENLIQEENTFRKQFSSSLKDKMLILRKEVKEVKK